MALILRQRMMCMVPFSQIHYPMRIPWSQNTCKRGKILRNAHAPQLRNRMLQYNLLLLRAHAWSEPLLSCHTHIRKSCLLNPNTPKTPSPTTLVTFHAPHYSYLTHNAIHQHPQTCLLLTNTTVRRNTQPTTPKTPSFPLPSRYTSQTHSKLRFLIRIWSNPSPSAWWGVRICPNTKTAADNPTLLNSSTIHPLTSPPPTPSPLNSGTWK